MNKKCSPEFLNKTVALQWIAGARKNVHFWIRLNKTENELGQTSQKGSKNSKRKPCETKRLVRREKKSEKGLDKLQKFDIINGSVLEGSNILASGKDRGPYVRKEVQKNGKSD
ncbi:hypothetical protein [Pseudoflavonifractor sp. An85]|uniref:hypothetical protein n=1 Tax=Pseudoflavonifractor sp. An85 TaxID=1965661 RepID=UPI00117A9457|nr:hypothetical protein [Pseudoflavonifractor sp. An85]